MSVSFDWCVKRAKNKELSGLYDLPWEKAFELPAGHAFNTLYSEIKTGNRSFLGVNVEPISDFNYHTSGYIGSVQREFDIEVCIDPDKTPTWFASLPPILYDSTLYTAMEHLVATAAKPITLCSVDDRLVATIMNGVSRIRFTAGNFVVLDEVVPKEKRDPGKPWAANLLCVLLPLSMEVD